ncbi:LysR family transcriptional regulator [Massilia antarctica]|uniref:LysR family transcriptional regulator n=1 Tax=Massilia antarctica TaxID=2765360 RepID=A0AA48WC17_9BURK|nr:LysR family transcriptional regulator [Massilia antarctica]QPI49766.1 LysR family transcriptional regulator [Massilia antarctica]
MHELDDLTDAARFDLNLLPFLGAVLECASITRAGEQSGMSQPAASRAMAKLRKRFGDPFLVRTGRGYVLTPLALQLAPLVRTALQSTAALFELAHFEPSSSSHVFRMASTDYGMLAILGDLLPRIGLLAPHASLRIDPWSGETLARLERGDLDCALYADDELPDDFHYRTLFSDGYGLICRRGHPILAQAALPALELLRQAATHPHFAVRYPGKGAYVTDNVYERLDLPQPQLSVELPYFHAGSAAVEASDLLAVVPLRAARAWSTKRQIVVVPLELAALQFEYRLIWHARAHRDPAFMWLRAHFIHAEARARRA